MKHAADDAEVRVPLPQAAEFLLEECRMVLPGIQALFGFQLIAVFSDGFAARLTEGQQRLHLAAIALVAVAIALIMTPAAYHRHRGVHHVSETFLRMSTQLVVWSMAPLAVALALDLYLVSRLVAGHTAGLLIAAAVFMVYVVLWGVLPRSARLARVIAATRKT